MMVDMNTKKIAFIGVGLMGKWMAANFLKAGYEVSIYDHSTAAIDDMVGQGATRLSSAADGASQCMLLFSSLPTPSALKDAIVGKNGIAAAIRSGAVLIDLSSVDPQTSIEMAQALREKGAHLLDCPVSGGVTGAEKGTLTIMAGGDESVFELVKPHLEVIGQNISYIGVSGMGQLVKLCHQSLVAITTVALGEAFLTGIKAGLQPEQLSAILRTGLSRGGILELFGNNIVKGTHENVLFPLDLMLKDLRLYVEAADAVQTPSRLAKLTLDYYTEARHRANGRVDQTFVCSLLGLTDDQLKESAIKI